MMDSGKVRVVVRSRKVPVATVVHAVPLYSSSGVPLGSRLSRLVLFGASYDQEHLRTIEEAKKLASNLGLGLEVVDESRSGLFTRVLTRFGLNGTRHPSVVISMPRSMEPAGPSPVIHGC